MNWYAWDKARPYPLRWRRYNVGGLAHVRTFIMTEYQRGLSVRIREDLQ